MLSDLVELVGAAEGRCAYAEARHVDPRRAARARPQRRRRARLATTRPRASACASASGGAWGFAATRDTLARRRRARAGARARDRRGAARRGRAPAHRRAAGARALDAPGRARPVRGPARGEARAARRGRGGAARRPAARPHRRRGAPPRASVQAFASTEGAACTQERDECGAGIAAIAVDDGELQVRTYPSAHGGHIGQAGWEHVLALDLVGNAPRVAAEAVELLTAPPCPSGRATVVLHPEQLALQVHESIGHALELDRILLGEAAYAGTSWVQPGDLGVAALRLRAPDGHRRRDAAGRARARSAGTTRAPPRGARR